MALLLIAACMQWLSPEASSSAPAAETEIRLVAADLPQQPSVDQLVDFRRAADGGLIATQWASGLELDGKPLFPIQNSGEFAPTSPQVAGELPNSTSKLKDEADDLLGDIKKEAAGNQKVIVRPVDVVDSIYAGKTFSLGRPIGPQRNRASSVTRELTKPPRVSPGTAKLNDSGTRWEVPCYPVTITASRVGEAAGSTTFVPQLTFAGRDLLADCLFEHSPDLPLGDTSSQSAANLETLEGWLGATRGGDRPFRRLTIYLPATGGNSREAYELSGHRFQVSASGVTLLPSSTLRQRTELRAAGKFGLELVLPAEKGEQPWHVPLLAELGAGWEGPKESLITVPTGASALTLTVHSPTGKSYLLRPSLPIAADEAAQWQLYVLLVAGRSAEELPSAYVMAISRNSAGGERKVLLKGADESGSLSLPGELIWQLTQPYPWGVQVYSEKEEPRKLTFEATQPGVYVGSTQALPAGGFLARATIGEAELPAIPLAHATEKTRGSVTLATYHNRCDYYRGEEVHIALTLRAVKQLELNSAKLQLQYAKSLKPLPVGEMSLAAPQGESRTRFLTLQTDALPLGEHTLYVETEDAIVYPVRFTLHSPAPRTTFALYSWMTGSFSGPVRVGDETTVNLLLDQKPTQFLRPEEVGRYTDQQTIAPQLKPLLASDPYLPAAEKTETYDPETELEMAVAMRLGLRHAPPYGWGLNSQEANWNPKHTLPEELARVQRLCSQVAQRFRDFGNYAGLHLNWYPTYGGYWENHPATDGNAGQRAALLKEQVSAVQLPKQQTEVKLGSAAELDLAVARHKFRVGALPRAYQAWTERASRLTPGMTDVMLSPNLKQPGLSPQTPLYSSFLPISWFDQQSYYPSTYFSTLPAATVHAYTDYGFSPFQPLWGLDFWAAGVGDKPKWVTTMSNGRDIMLPQALLAAARGADGIDINGSDPAAARVISELFTMHGPLFRELEPESDVAIITSLRQQIVHGKLVGRWMGYTGGTYFDLYTKLWYARRPADVLLEEELTLEKLQQYSAVFLVNQQATLGGEGNDALRAYVAGGGKVFKDAATSADFPGEVYKLESDESIGPKWEGDKYVATRDQMFVGVHASYEASAKPLEQLLAQLPAPRVTSPSHHTLLATLAGKEMAVVMAVNDTRTPPGIYHPWNFWSATVLAAEGKLSFDKPYVVYDLLDGGNVLRPEPDGQGRFSLPISFDRAAGRPLVLLPAEIKELRASVYPPTNDASGRKGLFKVEVFDARGQILTDPCPIEITVLDDSGRVQEQFYRAVTPNDRTAVTIPMTTHEGSWTVRVRELLSGLTAEQPFASSPGKAAFVSSSKVLLPRPREVQQFITPAKQDAKNSPVDSNRPLVILLDQSQAAEQDSPLLKLAQDLARKLTEQGRTTRVEVVDPLEIRLLPQRWRATERDEKYLAEMAAGIRVLAAEPLTTKYYQGERNRNEPDWVHPESGYGEPGAKYRIGTDVILLGLPETNRFLADLHAQVGMRPSSDWLASGSSVVQVVWDAFTPGQHALTIQGSDVAGLLAGIEAVEERLNTPLDKQEALPTDPLNDKPLVVHSENRRLDLPRWMNEFGAEVSPIAFTSDGGVLASANLQANNYFEFSEQGKLQKKWLGKYGLLPATSGETLWTYQWWGAPAYIDKVVRCDASAEPQWMMDAPRYSRGFQHWRHPGKAILTDGASDDLFVAGHCRLARLSSAGSTLWAYDDTPTANEIHDFRFRRDLMLHDVSPDGRLLLVAAFGIQPYANFVSKFVRPALMLFDARSGKLLWEKADILVDHSPCAFAALENGRGVNILVGDETPDHRRLVLLDEQGAEVWSIARPAGTSAAALTADGAHVVLREAARRSNIFQTLSEPQGLQVVRLADQSVRDFPVVGNVADWKLLAQSNQVLVSSETGNLSLFSMDARPVWEKAFPGPANLLISDDERRWVIGTPDGKLRWLDAQGETTRAVDLLPYNRVRNLDEYVTAYTRTPGDVPRIDPAPVSKPRIDARGQGVVAFSKNLLEEHKALDKDHSTTLTGGKSIALTGGATPGQTQVLSLTQRTEDFELNPHARLVVTVQTPGGKDPLYQAEVPLSANWEERTLAWRVPEKTEKVLITLDWPAVATKESSEQKLPAESSTAVELKSVGLFALSYPSENVLAQRVPAAPGEVPLLSREKPLGDLAGGKELKPPTLRYHIPNDVDLTALARGAPPFQRTVEFTTPFDGVLSGQKTSWLAKPLSGSTHATLEVEFDEPVALGSLAVFEDTTNAAHYTDTYALFIKEAKTGRMRQIGSVTGNQSPFNLFTFPKVEVKGVTYLWLKSGDGHARVAELEGYLAEEDLLE